MYNSDCLEENILNLPRCVCQSLNDPQLLWSTGRAIQIEGVNVDVFTLA